jgi:hypothetical protein
MFFAVLIHTVYEIGETQFVSICQQWSTVSFHTGPRGKSIFSAGFRELTDTRLGKEESAAADRIL